MPRKKKKENLDLELIVDEKNIEETQYIEQNECLDENLDEPKEAIETIDPKEEIKEYKVKIIKAEDKAFIVEFFGYSKRIYFDLPFNQLEYVRSNKSKYKNKLLRIYYIGELNAFTGTILPVTSLDDVVTMY